VHYLIANNGAGKTTLIKTLAGLLPPKAGNVTTPTAKSYFPEDLFFHNELPVSAIFRSLIPASQTDSVLKKSEAWQLDVSKPYGALSTGNQRKVAIILSCFTHQEAEEALVMLDEPFSGLDKESSNLLYEELQSRTEQTTLCSIHTHARRENIRSVIHIHEGKIIHTTDPDEIDALLAA